MSEGEQDTGSEPAGDPQAGPAPAGPNAGLDLRVDAGDATPEELAAITAVLQGVVDELAEARAATSRPSPSAWARSQRPLRGSHAPGPGAWRSFSG